MKGCDHDRIYSGQINLSRRYAWICLKCGEHDWSEDYVLSQVNLVDYHRARVAWGWGSPVSTPQLTKLPLPPRIPTDIEPKRSWWPFAPGAAFFAFLSVTCALSAIPWGALGPIMPLWLSLMGSGVALGTATLLFLCWRQGLR